MCGTVSPQGKWAYCAGEDGKVYVFDLSHSEGAQLEVRPRGGVGKGEGRVRGGLGERWGPEETLRCTALLVVALPGGRLDFNPTRTT